MAVGTRLEVLGDAYKGIEAIVTREVPEIKSMVSFIGGGGWYSRANSGTIRIALKPQAQRKRSSEDVAAALRRSLRNIPGVTIRTRPVRDS
jgi:HAE1 family hydrophobic/amphiphilic exporter-1